MVSLMLLTMLKPVRYFFSLAGRIVHSTLYFRSVHGSAVCVLRETSIRIWNPRHEREYASCYPALDRIICIIAGPSGERDTLMYRQELPKRHPALHRGGRLNLRKI
jgi:hypothetical protein